ncbi:hypothetical protein [Nonomuraea jiangxiensis]|uniref:Uncharacterized protein n=1 Tax=Nonomuraea jiangxiensis TaxID=633440 RepID=A0A1G8ELQ7_9ACTN|nr:hypothetical protein [Nonomuraea jiangxiensis]SDH70800.1 hypothetical protein SAMN05421869_10330 [Nonomuraea jiangxiensis]
MASRRSARARKWRSRHDESHSMRLAIGDLARAAAAPGWSRLTVHRAQTGQYARTTVTRDGQEIAVAGLDDPFQRLRELAYRADAGTWFTCELVFSPGTRGYTGHVDSAAPPFEDVPPVAALAELTTFPRPEPPGWLLAALPTAAPIGLPTTYGDHYERRSLMHREPPPPPPPISGTLSYLPATTLTVRAFEHGRRHGRNHFHLTDQAGHHADERLVVLSGEDVYWVARHGERVTDRGVRSITLDGGTLRLELTPEAADALETETSFETHLDLPPETIDALRTVLPGMLRTVTDAPRLIGF